MIRHARTHLAWLLGLGLSGACRHAEAPPPIRADLDATPGPGAKDAPTATATAAAAPATDAGPPKTWIACTVDADCALDDPCFASRCVAAAGLPPSPGCDESAPRPGTCRCADGRCALERGPGSKAKTAPCTTYRDCLLDATAGSCGGPWGDASAPIRAEGPFCRCDAGSCLWEWAKAVPCTTTADCGLAHDPLRPVSSKLAPRKKPGALKPCSDGERDSVCDPTRKICQVVSWKC